MTKIITLMFCFFKSGKAASVHKGTALQQRPLAKHQMLYSRIKTDRGPRKTDHAAITCTITLEYYNELLVLFTWI